MGQFFAKFVNKMGIPVSVPCDSRSECEAYGRSMRLPLAGDIEILHDKTLVSRITLVDGKPRVVRRP